MSDLKFKDPNEDLDYQFDFAAQMTADSDTISTYTLSSTPSGLTLHTDSNSTTAVTTWISGGTVGERYAITCSITTTGGRDYDRTRYLGIEQK